MGAAALGAWSLGPDEPADQPTAVENEVRRPMEARSLLPKPPAAAVGLALAGVEASGEECGGSVLAPSSASRNSSSTPRVLPCASRGMRGGPNPWRGRRGKRREEAGGREERATAVARGGGADGRARREGGGDDVDRTGDKISDEVDLFPSRE
jgi:hypothetical protein